MFGGIIGIIGTKGTSGGNGMGWMCVVVGDVGKTVCEVDGELVVC